jgi:hypothetical protein
LRQLIDIDSASRAYPEILQFESLNQESIDFRGIHSEFPRIDFGKIPNFPTTSAANVAVGLHYRIEARLVASQVQFYDLTFFVQNFQVAVHCAQADSRQPFPDDLVQFRGRRMCVETAELLQKDFALRCVSAGFARGHGFPPVPSEKLNVWHQM